MTQALKKQSAGKAVEGLRKALLHLAKDTSFRKMRRLTGEEDEEELERRRAEASFRDALARRIWWRLSREKRKIIRSDVVRQDPHYGSPSSGIFLDGACLREIERML